MELKPLFWDYNLTEEELQIALQDGEYKGISRKNILIRLLQNTHWYTLKNNLPPRLLLEALSEETLNGVFPKNLAEKYRYARHILQL